MQNKPKTKFIPKPLTYKERISEAVSLLRLAIGRLVRKEREKLLEKTLDPYAKIDLHYSPNQPISSALKTKHYDFLPGTKICREYRNVMHQVEVRSDGFEYMGQKWKSLSAIATKITGTQWNGPRFFGLRE